MAFWESLDDIDLGKSPLGQVDDIDRVFIGYLKIFFRDNPILLDPQEPNGDPSTVNIPVLYLMESPRSWKHGGDSHQTQYPMVTVQILDLVDSLNYPKLVGQYEEVRGASVWVQDLPVWKTFSYQVTTVADDPLTARRLSSAVKELVFPYRFGCRTIELGGENRPLSISTPLSTVDRDEGTFRTDYTFQVELPLTFDVGQEYDRISGVDFYYSLEQVSSPLSTAIPIVRDSSNELTRLDFS
jgi:hypothetical protein